MSERVFTRDVSPYFQQLLVKLMEEAYRARKAGDVEAYRVAVEHIYDSLPEHVRAEVLRELGKRLGTPVEDIQDVLRQADEECEAVMAKYGLSSDDKRARCTAIMMSLLNALYSVIAAKIHEKGLLSVTKVVQVGYA